nr:clusterin-associated protein 1 homolog [Penaeus vannamei]
MSYRELRNCAEMLRSLGFRRLISVENFRSPNFPLVSEILVWLVGRFDPSADLPTDVDTEQDRVIFVRSVAQFMAAKAHVRLNTKKLYQSDGYAVQEILKALTLLYDAIQSNAQSRRDFDDPTETTLNFDVSNKSMRSRATVLVLLLVTLAALEVGGEPERKFEGISLLFY